MSPNPISFIRMPLAGNEALFLCPGLVCVLLSLTSMGQENVISAIEIHGNRRIPAETIRARIYTRPGDVYDVGALERDFNSLWNTNYFQDIRFEREATPKGWIIHIYVKERPTIREIDYVGLNAVSKSDVLDRFKEAKSHCLRRASTIPPK